MNICYKRHPDDLHIYSPKLRSQKTYFRYKVHYMINFLLVHTCAVRSMNLINQTRTHSSSITCMSQHNLNRFSFFFTYHQIAFELTKPSSVMKSCIQQIQHCSARHYYHQQLSQSIFIDYLHLEEKNTSVPSKKQIYSNAKQTLKMKLTVIFSTL